MARSLYNVLRDKAACKEGKRNESGRTVPIDSLLTPGKDRIKGLWISVLKNEYSIFIGGGAVLMIRRILKSLTLSNVIGIPIIIALLIMLVGVMVNTLQ